MIPSLGCHVIELGKGGPVALTDYCNGDQTHKYTHGARKLVVKVIKQIMIVTICTVKAVKSVCLKRQRSR